MSHSKDSAHMLCSLLLARMHSLSPVALRQLAVAVDSPEKERLPTNWKDLVFLHLSHAVAFLHRLAGWFSLGYLQFGQREGAACDCRSHAEVIHRFELLTS